MLSELGKLPSLSFIVHSFIQPAFFYILREIIEGNPPLQRCRENAMGSTNTQYQQTKPFTGPDDDSGASSKHVEVQGVAMELRELQMALRES